MLRIILLLISSISISACIESSDANQSTGVQYTDSSSGVQIGISNQQSHIIKDASHLSDLISTTQLMGVMPNPDFSQNMLIGMFTTLNSCYSLSVYSVQDIDGSILITMNISSEGVNTCNPVIGNAYYFIELGQSSKQVSIIYKQV